MSRLQQRRQELGRLKPVYIIVCLANLGAAAVSIVTRCNGSESLTTETDRWWDHCGVAAREQPIERSAHE